LPAAADVIRIFGLGIPWWIVVPLGIYWVVVVVLVIADDREPASTLLWLGALVFLPGIGVVLFLFFGRDWKVITARRRWAHSYLAGVQTTMGSLYTRNQAAIDLFREQYPSGMAADIATTIQRENLSRPLPADSVDIFADDGTYFARLEQDLASARSFVHLDFFIWEHDELTARITAGLLERLRAGVEVRIVYDLLGSMWYRKTELQRLKAAGATVSADVWQLFKLNYRNHLKIGVIDGTVGYTGGANLGQEYIDGGRRFPAWRDTNIRITGQAVAELQKLFAMRWFENEREDILQERYLPPAADAPPQGQVLTQLVAHTIELPWEAARRAHMIAICQAEHSLRMQSPYFVPDKGTYDAMINAALRGVDLQLMMTGRIDKALPFWAAQTYYEPLLRAGARIFLYRAGFFHAKTIAVDSSICAVGTMNLDNRSLRLHKELMEWIYDAKLTRQLEAIFDSDLEHCREVTLADIQAVGPLKHFRNSCARLFSAEL
jgi:cardiolipin synthase